MIDRIPQKTASILTQTIKREALERGFQSVGIVSAEGLQGRRSELARWISSGFAGRLTYMEEFFQRQDRFLSRFADLKSILVLTISYSNSTPKPVGSKGGRVARYAWGRDYHRVIEKRLKKLCDFIQKNTFEEVRMARCIDTSPIQERALAELAGLGFVGKNTCLIAPKGGSFFFLAAVLLNVDLVPDQPILWNCGSCTLCLEACPTQALVQPYQLDARRCISYLTIELKESIEPSLRPLMHDWIFGCDICQEVCPYNRKIEENKVWEEFRFISERKSHVPLEDLLKCRTEEAFQKRFSGTPLMRAKREGLLRNAAIVAGNSKDSKYVDPLKNAIKNDSSPQVREHAAWALSQILNV